VCRRWPWRCATLLKALECRAGTLRGRQLRLALSAVVRDVQMRLPDIEPAPTCDPGVSLEEEWARRRDELIASIDDPDTRHSLWLVAMAQGRGMDFAVRESE